MEPIEQPKLPFYKREPSSLTVFLLFFVGIVLVPAISISVYTLFNQKNNVEETLHNRPAFCNVLGLNIHGDIVTYLPPEALTEEGTLVEDLVASEELVATIEEASNDPAIKAILLDIDSAGGLPVAAEEIVAALKKSARPTAAVIRQTGTSAAYWVASATDRIFASKNSDIGSIGVTMSYTLNDTGKYVELTSAKFKDTGSPDKPLTQEERSLLMRDLSIIHRNFVSAVAQNRNIDIEKVTQIADGSSVLGERAKELSLIDEIGSWDDATQYLKGRIGEEVSVCWE